MKLYLYELNEEFEIKTRLTINSLDEKLPFQTDKSYRYFLGKANSKIEYINIFTEKGKNIVGICPSKDVYRDKLDNFINHLHTKEILDEMTDRWGEGFVVGWLEEENDEKANFCYLVPYFTCLNIVCSKEKTFKEVIDDFYYICEHLKKAVNEIDKEILT
jgi:hypothetical protein